MRQEAIQMVRDRVTMQDMCRHLNLPINRSGFICCPFHAGDKNGSLKVYNDPARGWHCFGCGEGGDVITFARKWYGTNFPETIERLACEFNIPIPTRELTNAEKAEIEKHRREQERQRWVAQMEREQIESSYWKALDAYEANCRIIDEQDPAKIGGMSDEFIQALTRRDELKYNLDRAEDNRRMLYVKHHGCQSTAHVG